MWVAKDKDGYLSAYNHKPIRGNNEWFASEEDKVIVSDNYAVELTIPLSQDDYEEFENLSWDDEPVEVKLSIKKTKKKKKVKKQKTIKLITECTPEEVYYFEGCEPSWNEWVQAGIALEYGECEDDFEYYDYQWHRGDWDYTRQ